MMKNSNEKPVNQCATCEFNKNNVCDKNGVCEKINGDAMMILLIFSGNLQESVKEAYPLAEESFLDACVLKFGEKLKER